ncbi:hypothetical protein FB45DRAFT_941285 [Roridomyces roridus]|uniref:Uncharacterized protein n=1 Tax=Roridomyces roridus TaxID=1738132 RepID=A0AAD7B6A6_9AGAR|nr:hypothetical protein FB45DRAFT_941285 [Roridomyces roridus]
MMMAMQGLGPAIGTGRLESRVPQYQRYVDAPAEVSTPMPMPVEEQQHQQTMQMPVGMPSGVFQPDEAVWQQFLQSVGVEGGVATATVPADAMDVDAVAAATQDDHAQGTSGVALGLGHSPPAECLLPARYGYPDGPVCGSDESLARQDEQGLDRMYFGSGSLRRTTSGLG